MPMGTPFGVVAEAGLLGASIVATPSAEIAETANNRLLMTTPGVNADRPSAAGS